MPSRIRLSRLDSGGGAAPGTSHIAIPVCRSASFAAQGHMSMIVAFTALVLEHHGDPPAISVAVAIHVIGMFGFSLPVGWLADRAGHRGHAPQISVPARRSGLRACHDSALDHRERHVPRGTWMVSAARVAATAVIAEATHTFERGRATGTNDTASAPPPPAYRCWPISPRS